MQKSETGGVMMPEISIHVDSLVLHGIDAFDGTQFSASLNRELSVLLTDGGILKRDIEVGSMSIQAPSGISSATIGQHVAREIFNQMQRGM